jgi:hypothetical protein
VTRLRRRFDGQVLLPGEPGYQQARRVWNAMVDITRIWRGWTTRQNADTESTQADAAVRQPGRELVPTAVAAVDAQVLVTGDGAVLAVCQPQTSGRRRHGR